jgi:PhnB protein
MARAGFDANAAEFCEPLDGWQGEEALSRKRLTSAHDRFRLLNLSHFRSERGRTSQPSLKSRENVMDLNPYLNFDGQCEAAFKFYERCLDGKITTLVTFESMGDVSQLPEGWGKKIMHAHMTVGDKVLMGSDAPPGRFEKPQGFSMSVQVEGPAEADRVFGALSENGSVRMPLRQTPWAARFGMLTDQFGVPWMVNCTAAATATA